MTHGVGTVPTVLKVSASPHRWYQAPWFSDEEETRIGRVVHTLGFGILIATLIAILHNAFVPNWTSVGILTVELGFVTACLWLNQRGKPRVAARLIGIGSIVMVVGLQASGKQGVHDVSTLVYPTVIVLSGALLERRWFISMTLLAMLALGLQYLAELTGVVENQLSNHTSWRQLIDAEVILSVTALSVQLLMRSLRESMSQSRIALESLRESEELYRSLFESASEAIFLHEADNGAIVDVNPRACELYGYTLTELRALSIADLSVDAPGNRQSDALHRMAAASKGSAQRFEWQALARDGRAFWVEVHMRTAVVAGTLRLLASVRDIDERKRVTLERQRLEAQFFQAQKMESVGRLAGGVAHDFNNLLTCIGGNAELALLETDPNHPVALNLSEIQNAVQRASDLTRRLLAFSRKQPIAPKPIELPVLLDSSYRMLTRLLDETIELKFNIASDIYTILADPNQIEQILMNLVVNARDAMPDGGEIRVEVSNLNPTITDNKNYVRIRVSDTGVGIDTDTLPKIFEPFFTTKPVGKGTGLGLSMVLGAVQQNGGSVEVHSEMGKGTTFDIFLPALLNPSSLPLDARPTKLPTTGTERLLLVEDDDAVRHTSRKILDQLGYQVTAFASSQAAITAVETDGQEFDMLVTDVILPGLDGKALADRLSLTLPALRVLFCSGYTADIIGPRGVIDEGVSFLAKPYTRDELGNKIRSMLDRNNSSN